MNDSDSGLPSDGDAQNRNIAPQVQSSVAVVYARLPLPQLSSSNIESWFTTMDFWFTASGITSDKQKAATVLAALDPSVIAQLPDVISTMPLTERYNFVRTKIIEQFADSEQRRLNRLLSDLPLGDKKPSELYYEMKRVAGTTLGESALKGLWIKRLPDFVQPVVATSSGSAAEFTKIADSILDAVSTNQVHAVATHTHGDIEDLRAAVASLTKRFDKFTTRSRSRNREPRSRSRHKSSTNENTSDECWFHRKYGRNAQKCRSPCRHKKRSVNSVTSDMGATSS